MKRLIFLIIVVVSILIPALVQAQWGRDTQVRGYQRQDGTIVQPYHRTLPDNNQFNNYSTQGNINPWTGQRGTVNPYNNPMPQPHYPRRSSYR
jgi:hypothetical protein